MASSASGGATTNPSAEMPFDYMLVPTAIGLCVLVVWIIRRLANPAKLALAKTPGRPNSIHPGHVILLLAFWVAVQMAAMKLLGFWLPKESLEAKLLASLPGQVLWLVLCPVVAAATFRGGLGRGMGLSMRHWVYDTARAVLGYLAIFPVWFGLLWGMSELLAPQQMPVHDMLLAFRDLGGGWKVLVTVSVVVFAPLAEEMFFRGLVQSMLRRYLGRPWLAVALTSAAFAAMHLQYWHTMPALFALGIALGYNYERCGRLYPAILIHALFNAVNLAAWNAPQG